MSNADKALLRAGYTVEREAKSSYIRRMVGLAEPFGNNTRISNLDFLRDEPVLRLLMNAQIRKGRAYTYRELQQLAKPEADIEAFFHRMNTLVDNRIFLRGYRLVCNDCTLETWYPLTAIDHFRGIYHLNCECGGIQRLPLELNFAFRLNRLFAEGIKNGALSVLLATIYMTRNHQVCSWDTDLIACKNGVSVELDLLALCDSEWYIIECKDNLPDSDSLISQLQRNLKVAQDSKSNFYFATLAETIPGEVTAFCTENGIRILTRADLVTG